MRNDSDEILDDLLSKWHSWKHPMMERHGMPGKAAGFGESLSSSQYDWENGVEDALIERRMMDGFDAALHRIESPWFGALVNLARNLCHGIQVWSNPRLPKGDELKALLKEARTKLYKELAKDGVIC